LFLSIILANNYGQSILFGLFGLKILGITPVGRATCQRLDLNDEHHDDGAILEARWFWVQGGWHPPVDDPKVV
jgi:hypothetical protein